MLRYVRAFFTALRMTWRGQQPPMLRYPQLTQWLEQGRQLAQAAIAAADAAGFERAARQAAVVRVDGRDYALEVLLQGLYYHLATEYPHLLRSGGRYSLMAIYAGNLNDCYWVRRILETESAAAHPPFYEALRALLAHLEAQPSELQPTPETPTRPPEPTA